MGQLIAIVSFYTNCRFAFVKINSIVRIYEYNQKHGMAPPPTYYNAETRRVVVDIKHRVLARVDFWRVRFDALDLHMYIWCSAWRVLRSHCSTNVQMFIWFFCNIETLIFRAPRHAAKDWVRARKLFAHNFQGKERVRNAARARNCV